MIIPEVVQNPSQPPTPISINTGGWIDLNCPGGATNYAVRDLYFYNPGANIPFEDVAYYFPIGSRFYDEIDVNVPEPYDYSEEFTISTGFPSTPSGELYYVIPPGNNNGCYWKFHLHVVNHIRSNRNVTRQIGY